MKRPIDLNHANKWLIGFSIASFIFSIVFFVSGIIPGGIALLVVAIFFLIPQIIKKYKQNKPQNNYSNYNKKVQEKKNQIIEEAIQQTFGTERDKED